MFKRIMVPLDGSARAERALPIAARIAQASDGVLVLVRVVNVPMGYRPSQAQGSTLMQEVLDSKAEARQYLTGLSESDMLTGISCEVEVLHGAPALAILDTIPKLGADLVVICSHGKTDAKRWAMGSVARKIASHSSIPVLILREDGKVPFGPYPDPTRPLRAYRSLVALDGSQLAQLVLEPTAYLIAALAKPARGTLHMTHVIPLPSDENALDDENTKIPALQEKALYQAKKYLRNICEDVRDALPPDIKLSINWSVAVDTDVAQALIDVAEKGIIYDGSGIDGGCDLIALTTHGNGGVQDWTIGIVAERVLNTSNLPVLIVRPPAAKRNVQRMYEATVEAEF
ncbi:MAG TPA: universal stress protein [Ktedonobacteraceae bacterium]|nr:universal stress protein [Ktedonobacteraceae bacterium]